MSSDDALIEKGLELRRQRRDEDALQLFRQAYEAHPTPRTRAQIALAEQALGKWIEAERDLGQAISAGDDAWIRANLPHLQKGLGAIQAHLSSLTVTSNVAGAELWIDGARIASLPGPAVRVVSGSTVIEVRAAGYETLRRPIVVPQGVLWREEVRLLPAEQPRAARVDVIAEPAAPPSGGAQRSIGAVIGGIGLAGLGAGAVFGVLASAAKSDYDRHCGANIGAPAGLCDADGVEGRNDAAKKATFSTAFFIGGGVAGALGAILFFTAPRAGGAKVAPVGVYVGWGTLMLEGKL